MTRVRSSEAASAEGRDAPSPINSAPLYLRLAQQLQQRIGSGEYPVGALLPTEHELAESFGVSRQTVRQAIGHLRGLSLLSARKGVGTRVEADRPERRYTHALQSLEDVLQYASDTVLRVTGVERITAQGRLAAELGCRPGRAWLRLHGLREAPGQLAPICSIIVHVDARFAKLVESPGSHTTGIFAQIEAHYGEVVQEVRQEIEAVVLDAAQADRLSAPPGSAGLLITRRFFGAGHRLLEMSESLHPAGRFRYAMTIQRNNAE